MEFRFKSFCVALLVGTASLGLHAQDKLVVDPVKSEVHFTLRDVLHTVHGTFRVQQGEVHFNSLTGEAGGSIVVGALSGESGNTMRDNRMKKDVLKAESFTTVTFAPTKFTGKLHEMGDSALQVHGVFTLLGTPHEIDVPIEVQVSGNQLHATGTFSVPYVKWGLKDPSTLMLRVNKEVEIDLLLVGTVQH